MSSGPDSLTSPHDPSRPDRRRGALGLVRASNRALVRSVDESELLAEICRIATKIGGYRMAWVGLAQDESASVHPVVWAGHEAGYLAAIGGPSAEGRRADEPVAIAIATGQPVVVDRIDEAADAPWAAEAAGRGFRSVVALPLGASGRTFGALAIYADTTDAFGPDVVDLLTELSEDLGFGLVSLRVRAERTRLAAAVEQAADSVTVTDREGRIAYVNRAFELRSGFRREDVVGLYPRGLRGQGADTATFQAMWTTVNRGEVWTGSLIHRNKDGRPYEEEMVVSPLHDDDGSFIGYVASGRDVSRERELEGELERRARAEAELATRLSRVRALDTPEATASAILDEMASVPGLDFLAVEAFGTGGLFVPLALRVPPSAPLATGRPIPAARSAYLRERALAGPWLETWQSGPEDGTYAAQMFAAGIRGAAYAPIFGPTELVGLVAVGTSAPAVAARIGDHLPTLLSFAAIAGALLGPTHEQHRRDADATAKLEAIIADEAFFPVFQPIVTLGDRRVIGYEALTRFTDGVTPGERFATATRLGLGSALELACLDRALAAADRLPEGTWLSFNASPGLLRKPAGLAELLASHRRDLVLEVTEDAAVDDYEALRGALASLGPLVRLAVDDAGAGYAGLQRIVELRPDIVKLDLGLVRGVEADPARQALIAGMAHFATQTGSQLLAEGIETEVEAGALVKLGVDLGQGYLFGRPQPPAAAAARVGHPSRTRRRRLGCLTAGNAARRPG